jgi:hypothetical protein
MKSKKKTPRIPVKSDDNEQSQRFIETARALEVDESDESFNKAVKVISQREFNSRSTSKTKPSVSKK